MTRKKRKENKTDSSVKIGDITNNSAPVNVGSGSIKQDSHNVDTGGAAYVGGSVTVSGGGSFIGRDQITTTTTTTTTGEVDTAAIQAAFEQLAAAIASMSDGFDRNIAEQAAAGLQEEALKPEAEVEENKVKKWFDFLAQTAPDAFDVAVETFKNPIKGLSTVFQKIAQRAREEKEKKG